MPKKILAWPAKVHALINGLEFDKDYAGEKKSYNVADNRDSLHNVFMAYKIIFYVFI